MDHSLLEQFALAEDRSEPAQRAIPGSEEENFLRPLLHQQRGELEAARKLLSQPRHEGKFHQQLLLRQLLLEAHAGNEEAWSSLLQGERFDHRCQLPGKTPPLPSRFSAQQLNRQVFVRQRLQRPNEGPESLTERGISVALEEADLQPAVRRKLLEQLRFPQHPRLLDLLIAELGSKPAKNFGNLVIHTKLTMEQLEALAERAPDVLGSQSFVHAYTSRIEADPLGPADEEERLARLLAFVDRLPKSFSEYQAQIIQRRIQLRWRRAEADHEGLIRYFTLTAPSNPENRNRCVLSGSLEDEVWMQEVLRACIRKDGTEGFKGLMSGTLLRHLHAEEMLLSGAANPERWMAMLEVSQLRQLQERVDLELAPQNPEHLPSEAEVALLVDVKNVETLAIRIFHIDTLNYYRARGGDVGPELDLDGFVPNHERILRLNQPSILRKRIELSFPELKTPGTYIIDLVGGGRSCRALIRKGSLLALERPCAAGLELTILDEHRRPVSGATVWLENRAFEAASDGTVVLPFSPVGTSRTVLLQQGTLTSLQAVLLPSESYELEASFHVEQEDLIPGAEAHILAQARLLLAGVPVSLSLLEHPRLVVTATCEGIASERTYEELKLGEQGHLSQKFTVPERLDRLQFRLEATLVDLQGGQRAVSASGEIQGSGFRGTSQIQSLHLLDEPGGWTLLVLGRAGEPISGVSTDIELWSDLSTHALQSKLQSDESGRIVLGPLHGVHTLRARIEGHLLNRKLQRFFCDYPSQVNVPAGKPFLLPEAPLPPGEEPPLALYSASEHDIFFHDCSSKLRRHPGAIEIDGLAPGHYLLTRMGEPSLRIRFSVYESTTPAGWGVLKNQLLAPQSRLPARVTLSRTEGSLDMQIEGASSSARVMLWASALAHAIPHFLTRPPLQSRTAPRRAGCHYTPARTLGDEARYVLARRHAPRRAGNMLPRPSLLLNPWVVGETSTLREQLRESDDYQSARAMAGGAGASYHEETYNGPKDRPPELDFLARPALLLADLRPDEQGKITIPLEMLEGRGVVRVLLLDGVSQIAHQIAVGPAELRLRELRLRSSLDPTTPYALLGEETVLMPGERLALGDARYRIYDSLPKVWALLETLDPEQRCTRFEFLKRWPSLDDAQKQKHYSENACHELNYFLYRKDLPFFERVIRPYLASKQYKTFLDLYLLGLDLTEFREPSRFSRLNALERILLAERLGEQDLERDAQKAATDGSTRDLRPLENLFRAALLADALSDEPEAPNEREPSPAKPKPGRSGAGQTGAARKRAAPRAAASRMTKSERARSEEEVEVESEEDEMFSDMLVSAEQQQRDVTRRASVHQLYRALDATREYAEQHYYRKRLSEMDSSTAPLNSFWAALAAHRGPGPFLSPRFLRCTDGSASLLLALAVLDLPMEPSKYDLSRDESGGLTLQVTSPAIVFHEQIKPARRAVDTPSLLVAQHYLAPTPAGQPHPVSGEFLVGAPYNCQIIVSNPSPYPQQIDLLLQLPEGSLPLGGAHPTRRERIHLGPYSTSPLSYSFYFPADGVFSHRPTQASQEGVALASAQPNTMRVVRTLSSVDASAWSHLSQAGTNDEVLAALESRNLHSIDLEQIAWRLQERAFYDRALETLERRRFYHPTVWSYAMKHRDLRRAAEYLKLRGLEGEGIFLDSPWLSVDPREEGFYEHLEYAPLVNPRAHGPAGAQRILNDRLAAQVERLLVYLCSKASLNDEDRLAVVYYWLLQDRVDEATSLFRRIQREAIPERLQYDYASAYLAFFGEPSKARAIAIPYADYPVDRWRDRFREVLAQLDEIEGHLSSPTDPADRDQQQTHLATMTPTVELRTTPEGLRLHHRHAPSCRLSFYEMDLELIFSQRPFSLQAFRERPPLQPNHEVRLELGPGEGIRELPIPEALRGKPMLIEATSGEARATAAYTEGALTVQIQEAYGQLRVIHATTGAPLPRVYVKVYAQDGQARFHKDGYTDLRGRFDYVSVSGAVGQPSRYALLLLSDEHGSALREVKAPTR